MVASADGKRMAHSSQLPTATQVAAMSQFCAGGRLRNGSPCSRGTSQSCWQTSSQATCAAAAPRRAGHSQARQVRRAGQHEHQGELGLAPPAPSG